MTTITFNTCLYNFLKRAGKNTIGDLLSTTEEELLSIKYLGPMKARLIIETIEAFKKECGDDIEKYVSDPFLLEGVKETEPKPLSPEKEKEKTENVDCSCRLFHLLKCRLPEFRAVQEAGCTEEIVNYFNYTPTWLLLADLEMCISEIVSERDKHVFYAYWRDGKNFREAGENIPLSKERTRQVIEKTLRKLFVRYLQMFL